MGSVYLIRNTRNSKWYVASTVSPRLRRRQHFSDLRCLRHPNIYLQRAFTKHSESAFEWFVLEEAPDEALAVKEKEWIGKLSAADPEHGYNLTNEPYTPMRGKTHTPEVVAHLREVSQKGESHHNSKYTEGQILEVFALHKAGNNQLQIERLTGIDATNVYLILRGKAWKHLGFEPVQGRTNNKSGCVGVYKAGKKWKAEIIKNKKYHSLGCYHVYEDAVKARKEAEREVSHRI